MRCHWHRLHSACGVNDTACTIKFSNNFEKWKSYAKRRCYAKKIKNACGVIAHRIHGACGVIDTACKIWHHMHSRRTIRMALAAFKGNIYQKHTYMFSNCTTPPLKKYINLKGLPNISIIFRRIRSRIQKGFTPWIRGPGSIVWWKQRRSEISWHCPLKSSPS
jgi:hypothetical protein